MILRPLCGLALAAALSGVAFASPVTFDFEFGIGGFNTTGVPPSTLDVGVGPFDGSMAAELTIAEDDGFVLAFQNFNSLPENGNPLPFNEVLEQGGTLTGEAVFTDLGGLFSGGTDPAVALPQVFVARQGSVTGFDLTDSDDNDDNFNFTGDQTLGVPFTFSFDFPTITGKNGVDSGGFYGFALGVSDLGPGGVVVFDNVVFTPIPEPASLGLLALAGVASLASRRR
ncbi:MAG: PEP-CTERM sorting domain-containing protein [Planctomycetota bacterium]